MGRKSSCASSLRGWGKAFGGEERGEVFDEEEGSDGVNGENLGELVVISLRGRLLGVENTRDRE